MKKIFLMFPVILLGTTAFGQVSDSVSTKKINHFLGIQGNELIRQVFNFNGTNAVTSNPYLLTYSFNSARNGWGGRIGLGYTYRKFSDNNGITFNESNINDLQARAGIEKAFKLSGRWSCGVGLDAIINRDDDHTITKVSNFDTTTTDIRSVVENFGGGTMAWLRFAINRNILIGTEASFYYVQGSQKQNISITHTFQTFPPQSQTFTSSIETDFSEGIFRMPVSFYLIVSF